ncbi:uncharacterized protein EV422DRAFT_118973 [Fimicolochytrium jonesii]|uniref:uncharacterized protein n=1 Tax=Fimicolochytrium jonesii TaxID=1396493 RepID=UPI0022FEA5E9|nr:uncharacterized protein EV422DRAFT_118973 [Fimicolochytrium jonesii]KAI8819134.1 hypothetical protein EV422DRAFT_118973 [Fimicolochytrium jonesii]
MKTWMLDPATKKVANTTTPVPGKSIPVSSVLSDTSQMQVGTVPTVRTPYFRVNRQNAGLIAGLIATQRFEPETAPLPLYACTAGFQADKEYNTMLRTVKAINSSVIAMFELDQFRILASSNMVLPGNANEFSASGTFSWANAAPDAVTLELRDKLRARFNNDTSLAVASVASMPSFEMDISDSRWIVNIGLPALSATDTLILVAAVPRSEIYGVIDAARARSRGISAGISVAAAFTVAVVFVLAVLPLYALAKQMEQLTKLDFGTLESSGALEKRSLIWELRQVQIVFGTMVKAFAGAIKKNKQIMNKQQSNSQVGAGTRSAGTAANQSRQVLPVGRSAAL